MMQGEINWLCLHCQIEKGQGLVPGLKAKSRRLSTSPAPALGLCADCVAFNRVSYESCAVGFTAYSSEVLPSSLFAFSVHSV